MRNFIRRSLPQSVRGQLAAIIFVAVIVIMSTGSVVESFTRNIDLPVIDDSLL
ncbi:MAG: sensor histidine kinase, partial [Mesorhizobium sp.]